MSVQLQTSIHSTNIKAFVKFNAAKTVSHSELDGGIQNYLCLIHIINLKNLKATLLKRHC